MYTYINADAMKLIITLGVLKNRIEILDEVQCRTYFIRRSPTRISDMIIYTALQLLCFVDIVLPSLFGVISK